MKNVKKNKKVIIIVSLLVLLTFAFLTISLFKNNENSLTLEENKWLDSNKYNVVDISVLNDIPILSYSGKGIVYSFFDYVTNKYSIKFNFVPYNESSLSSYNYAMAIKNTVDQNDISILEDNLVLILKSNKKYNSFEDINNLKIGILNTDKVDLDDYFRNKNVEFILYDSYKELNSAFNDDTVDAGEGQDEQEKEDLDGLITLKTLFMQEIVENNYTISFEFNDLNRYYILSTSGPSELNSILKKNYNLWSKKNLRNEYNKLELSTYFTFKNVSDIQVKNLQSKNYVYGFIDYGIYNHLSGNAISGLSSLIIKDFNLFSNLSMTYTRYNSISKLLADFESGKVDFLLNVVNSNYSNVYNTINVFDDTVVVVSNVKNSTVVDSVYSLKDKQVLTIKDSIIEKYLLGNNIKVRSYNNLNDLINDYNSSSIAIVDLENYNYYKTSAFKNSKIDYVFNLNDGYNFVIYNSANNQVFEELFNFYLNFNSVNRVISTEYEKASYKTTNIIYILLITIAILLVYVVLDFSSHVKAMMKVINKNKRNHLTKEDKIKYIDQLTSLKNRAYFNSKIESWDDSEVYPQSIIIIDLNNISYINDNYGREEGDKVITEAANILIQNQLQNTEIIRTDGNEFMVYMVGYDEKQVVTYLRKLNKELKELSHGFGAASGYSIITDEIKTIDDAVNEATLDMKNNKEDIEY